MKQFDIDMSKGATSNVDIIPPPSLSHGDVPFTYMYASLHHMLIHIHQH